MAEAAMLVLDGFDGFKTWPASAGGTRPEVGRIRRSDEKFCEAKGRGLDGYCAPVRRTGERVSFSCHFVSYRMVAAPSFAPASIGHTHLPRSSHSAHRAHTSYSQTCCISLLGKALREEPILLRKLKGPRMLLGRDQRRLDVSTLRAGESRLNRRRHFRANERSISHLCRGGKTLREVHVIVACRFRFESARVHQRLDPWVQASSTRRGVRAVQVDRRRERPSGLRQPRRMPWGLRYVWTVVGSRRLRIRRWRRRHTSWWHKMWPRRKNWWGLTLIQPAHGNGGVRPRKRCRAGAVRLLSLAVSIGRASL